MAVDNAGVAGPLVVPGSGNAMVQQCSVRHGGITDIHIGPGCAVIPNGTAGKDQITQCDILLQRAAGADTDHGGDANGLQLLDGDTGGAAAHAGGHGQHRHTLIGAGKAAVFPVIGDFFYVFQLEGNAVQSGGVTGKNGTARLDGFVQLNVRLQHKVPPLFIYGSGLPPEVR